MSRPRSSDLNCFFVAFALATFSSAGALGLSSSKSNPSSADGDAKRVEIQDEKSDKVRNLADLCFEDLSQFPGPYKADQIRKVCAQVDVLETCSSIKGKPIYHYDKASSKMGAKRILVLSLIHGDETHAGSVGRYWMERLEDIDPRNSWRVVPLMNPDGVVAKTRTNANQVDLNRNFPTKDWDHLALDNWKTLTKSNPRRFPGSSSASEPETRCALKHIESYKPDFVVSIHTPLRVLDFDGPKVKPPIYSYLPWKSLGHFPGSLGRFLWFERHTPVLTLELNSSLPRDFEPFVQLHDVIGQLVKHEINPSPEKTQ
jgi:protein MpaA